MRSGPLATERLKGVPLRVLVVDDNVDAAHAMKHVLKLSGHRVTLAHDGPGALAAAAAEPPELVLLDIGLPGMDGYAVAARLREAGHDRAALVAITGYGQEEDLRRSSAAGFDHHLVKPVDGAVLRKIIADLAAACARLAPRKAALTPTSRASGRGYRKISRGPRSLGREGRARTARTRSERTSALRSIQPSLKWKLERNAAGEPSSAYVNTFSRRSASQARAPAISIPAVSLRPVFSSTSRVTALTIASRFTRQRRV